MAVRLAPPKAIPCNANQYSLTHLHSPHLDGQFFEFRGGSKDTPDTTTLRHYRLSLDHLHNDSTTLTFSGQYADTPPKVPGRRPARLAHGHNKDHRPDLKQLVLSLSITADGHVPVHYSLLDGNTTDDTTHIETWNALRDLRTSPDFLYIADSKLCTKENLAHIAGNSGKFITVLTRTRAEVKWFKDRLQQHCPSLHEVMRHEDSRNPDGTPDFYYYADDLQHTVEGYRLLWFKSSQKWELDQLKRRNPISAASAAITALLPRLGSKKLKTKVEIEAAIESLLATTGARRWIKPVLLVSERETFKQSRPGRPGKNTTFERQVEPVFSLSWALENDNITYDAKSDGFFPLVTNLEEPISPGEVLRHYKQQAFLEKRHEQLKTVLEIAPVFIKTPERIEAFVFIYFVALLLHSLVERQLREAMSAHEIKRLPVYPEARECEKPTAEKVLALFESLRRHRLLGSDAVMATFFDPMSEIQRQVLSLLNVPLSAYGQ